MQETRKILIWEFPVPRADRSDGLNGIRGGIFASPELSITPGGRFCTQIEKYRVFLEFCQFFFAKKQNTGPIGIQSRPLGVKLN